MEIKLALRIWLVGRKEYLSLSLSLYIYIYICVCVCVCVCVSIYIYIYIKQKYTTNFKGRSTQLGKRRNDEVFDQPGMSSQSKEEE